MAEFERYQSQSGVSVGPLETTYDTYKGYKQAFDKIEQAARPVAQSLIDQEARKQGEIAAQNPGFHTAPAIGEASKIFNQSAITANRMSLTSDAITNINKFKNEAMGLDENGIPIPGHPGLTQQSLEKFNSDVTGYFSGKMEITPDENRQYLTQLSAIKTTSAMSLLSSKLRTIQNKHAAYDFAQHHDVIKSQMTEAFNQGDPKLALDLMSEDHKQASNLVDSGSLSPSYALTSQKDLKHHFIQESYLSRYKFLLEHDKEKAPQFLSHVLTNDELRDTLGRSGQKSLYNYMKTIGSANGLNQAITYKQYSTRVNTALQGAFNQHDSNIDDLNNIHQFNITHNKEGDNEDFDQELQIAREAGSYVSFATNGKVSSIPDLIDEVNTKLKNIDFSNPLDSKKIKWFTQAQKRLSNIKDKFNPKSTKYDPVSIITQSNGYKQLEAKIAEDPEHNHESLKQDYIENYQLSNNIKPTDVRYLTKDQINSWNGRFLNASFDDRVSMMNVVSHDYGNRAGQVFRNLQSNGNTINYRSVYAAYVNPLTKNNAQSLLQSMLAPNKYFEGMSYSKDQVAYAINTNSDFINYANTLHAQGIYTDVLGKHLDQMVKYSRYLQQSQHMDFDKANDQAIKTILSDQIQTQSLHGHDYIVQNIDNNNKPIDIDTVKGVLHYLSERAVLADGVEIPPGMDKQSFGIKMHSQVRVKNVGSDGFQITDNAQNPISFKDLGKDITYHDIQDIESPVMKKFVNAVVKKYGEYTPENVKKYANDNLPDIKRPNTNAFLTDKQWLLIRSLLL